MYAVRDLPTGLRLPPLEQLVEGPPRSLFGMSVDWPTERSPVPVFVDRFRSPADDFEGDLSLFGARYDIADALFDGAPLGSGHVVEYFLVARRAGEWRARRLLQRESVTYTEIHEDDDHVPIEAVDSGSLSLPSPPRWESPPDAIWPTAGGVPMVFLGQTRLPENDVTRTLLTWDVTLYVFWLRIEGDDRFKLVEQRTGEQSAADHYALEDELDL